ncbi:permease [Zavarzinella formosa]|uniref:permease n=1 Tax=Zavarzinella formosa TaxID=360055 RepID=UPI0002F970A6|nr:permease [Zavarzinella formosa]
MNEAIFQGILLRTAQAAIEASMTVLCGLLVVGVMRRMLGTEGVRKLFGGFGARGLLRAWGVGTLLPVCSLGVIPIACEMRRCGVRSGTVLAFVLAAPHINPLSLLYGLTLSEPMVIICFAIGSLMMAVTAGALWEFFLARAEDTPPPEPETLPAPGLKRLLSVLITAGQESVRPAMLYVLLGVSVTGLASGLLPHGCLSHTMRHDDPTSPLLMTAIATPLYAGPLQGMMRLGLIFEHGNSAGAAFALFELGIGVNAGLFVWMATLYGVRRVTVWFAVIMAMTVGLAYVAERTLYFAHEEASHTHAFDEWTSPFPADSSVGWAEVRQKLLQKIEVLEPVSVGGLALLMVVGWLARRLDRAGGLERWLVRRPPVSGRPTSLLNRQVPGPVLGIFALLGLVAFSIAALFIYYPAPQATFDEIAQVRAEAMTAVNTGNKEEAIRQIQHWDLLTRKLQVGVFIRTGRMDKEAGQATEDLRECLEELRDTLLADNPAGARQLVAVVSAAHRKCRDAYAAFMDK